MLGYYGTTFGEKNPTVVVQSADRANKPAITCRPADLLEPSWEPRRTEALAAGCNGSDEDVLTYAMFPNAASHFFKTRAAGPKGVGEKLRKTSGGPELALSENASSSARMGPSRSYLISVGGEEHKVTVTPAQ
jgi:methylmalonyl-CoA carboxyltransferase 5S subunit